MSDRVAILPNKPGWPVEPLRDATSHVGRGTAPVYVDSSDVSAIGQRCVTRSDFDPSAARPHSTRSMGRVLKPEPGDVLVNSTGTGTIGRSVIFNDQSRRYIVDGHVTVVRPRQDVTESRWINDLLRSPWGQSYLESHCYSGSTNQIELAASALATMPVSLPPLGEQRRIAKILETVDDQIRFTEQMIAKLKRANDGLLHDLILSGIGKDGRIRDRMNCPTQFKDSVLGKIPNRWLIVPAEEACEAVIDCKNRTPPPTKEGHPVIRTPNVRDGEFVSEGLLFTDPQSYTLWTQREKPRPGDVLITREAPAGEVCLLPQLPLPACLGQRMMMYRPNPTMLDAQFMVAAIMSTPVQKVLFDMAGGSTVGHVRVGDIRRLPIPVPPIEEQKRIADSWQAARSRILAETAARASLQLLKHGLVTDLLTGRIRVPAEAAS